MKKHSIASPNDLAVALLRMGKAGEVFFATHYETDVTGEIKESSIENWHGATILNRFDGYCLLVGCLGGGDWYAYDVTNSVDVLSADMLESAFSSLLRENLEISNMTVCMENMTDTQLEDMWGDLTDIPFDEANVPGDMILAVDWCGFPKGTDRETIWLFFDRHHSKGVAYLLYGENETFEMEIQFHNHNDPANHPPAVKLTGESILALKDCFDEAVLNAIGDFDKSPGFYHIEVTFTKDGEYVDSDEVNIRLCNWKKREFYYVD